MRKVWRSSHCFCWGISLNTIFLGGCVDEEGNGFDPTVKSVFNHANLVDHSSLRFESSCINVDSSTQALLGEMTGHATDWLSSTRPTTMTWEGSTKV